MYDALENGTGDETEPTPTPPGLAERGGHPLHSRLSCSFYKKPANPCCLKKHGEKGGFEPKEN